MRAKEHRLLVSLVYSWRKMTLLRGTSPLVSLVCGQENDHVDVRGYLHRDGSVLMALSVKDLQDPMTLFPMVGL